MGDEATETTRAPRPRLSPEHHAVAVRVLLTSGIVAAVTLLILLLWYAVQVLLLMFVGILLAIIIRAAAEPFMRYLRLPDVAAVLLVMVIAAGLLGLIGWWSAPVVAEQSRAMAERIPSAINSLATRLQATAIGDWLMEEEVDAESLREPAAAVLTRMSGMLYTAAEVMAGVIIILFVAIYAAATPTIYATGLLRLSPKSYRPRLRDVMAGIGYTLRWWLLGQLVSMTIVGIMTGLGLWLLGVPLPVPLAMLAFALEFVPNFGPIAAAVPAILLALAGEDPSKTVYVVLLYIGVQQSEGLLLTPLIQRRAVRLPPVLTIMGQLLMGLLAGPIGLVLATPLTATAMVLTRMLYIEDLLGDDVATPDKEATAKDRPSLPDDDDDEQEPAGA